MRKQVPGLAYRTHKREDCNAHLDRAITGFEDHRHRLERPRHPLQNMRHCLADLDIVREVLDE